MLESAPEIYVNQLLPTSMIGLLSPPVALINTLFPAFPLIITVSPKCFERYDGIDNESGDITAMSCTDLTSFEEATECIKHSVASAKRSLLNCMIFFCIGDNIWQYSKSNLLRRDKSALFGNSQFSSSCSWISCNFLICGFNRLIGEDFY